MLPEAVEGPELGSMQARQALAEAQVRHSAPQGTHEEVVDKGCTPPYPATHSHPIPEAPGVLLGSTHCTQATASVQIEHSLLQGRQLTPVPAGFEFQYPLLHTHPIPVLVSGEEFASLQNTQL